MGETLAEVMREVASETLEELLKDKYPDGNHGYSEADFHAAAKVHLPVKIAKIDCVKHLDFCREQSISAYPTLRLFVKGEKYGEYRGDRTVLSFTNYLATIEETVMQESGAESGAINNADKVAAERMSILKQNQNVMPRRMKQEWKDEEHPGCQLSGFLMVDRVPGNFHIKARSKAHDLV